jgi:prepilin-type N-terminal cleavage/methylation domain-containing protein
MRKAFTILELLVVIFVISILSFMVAQRLPDDHLRSAADQIISHIRYTQHLAMVDNRYDPTDQYWYYERWRIDFRDCAGASTNKYYVVFHDTNHGGASAAPGRLESAINPKDRKYLYNDGSCEKNDMDSSEVLIGSKYGIIDFQHTGGCQNNYIAFDQLGRPYSSTYGATPADGLFQSDCNLTFSTANGSFTITIEQETGYVWLSAMNH